MATKTMRSTKKEITKKETRKERMERLFAEAQRIAEKYDMKPFNRADLYTNKNDSY